MTCQQAPFTTSQHPSLYRCGCQQGFRPNVLGTGCEGQICLPYIITNSWVKVALSWSMCEFDFSDESLLAQSQILTYLPNFPKSVIYV